MKNAIKRDQAPIYTKVEGSVTIVYGDIEDYSEEFQRLGGEYNPSLKVWQFKQDQIQKLNVYLAEIQGDVAQIEQLRLPFSGGVI